MSIFCSRSLELLIFFSDSASSGEDSFKQKTEKQAVAAPSSAVSIILGYSSHCMTVVVAKTVYGRIRVSNSDAYINAQ